MKATSTKPKRKLINLAPGNTKMVLPGMKNGWLKTSSNLPIRVMVKEAIIHLCGDGTPTVQRQAHHWSGKVAVGMNGPKRGTAAEANSGRS